MIAPGRPFLAVTQLEQSAYRAWLEANVSSTAKYLLLQIPGWLLVTLVALVLMHWDWIDWPAAFVLLGLWLLKDIALYPVYRHALQEPGPGCGPERLIGCRGQTRTEVNGRGLIEVNGERWLARADGGRRIAPATRVEVTACEGMVLRVRPCS